MNLFASYATPSFEHRRDALCESALAVGFDEARGFGPQDLIHPKFPAENRALLDESRGAGFWIWKPWIIKQALAGLSPGDVLVYSDAGRTSYYAFELFPSSLIERARTESDGFLLGPTYGQHGDLATWTKRDCLVLMDADSSDYLHRPQIGATWSIWTPTRSAFDFLNVWSEFCNDVRCLTDAPNELGLPNYDRFRDHRHDQSILSILAYKEGAPYVDLSNSALESVLKVRPQSTLANLFMKRIDDAERLARGEQWRAVGKALVDSKRRR